MLHSEQLASRATVPRGSWNPEEPTPGSGVDEPEGRRPEPTTTQLPNPEGLRRTLMDSIQEIMTALEQCERIPSDVRVRQARGLLEEALDRRLAELRTLDAQIARGAMTPNRG